MPSKKLKATILNAWDVSELTSVTDYMVIASGTSNRHVKSVADSVMDVCKKQGVRPLGMEGQAQSEWVLVDLGDVVVHVMLPATRAFYDLERLWESSKEELVTELS